jgi:hypothetical protein
VSLGVCVLGLLLSLEMTECRASFDGKTDLFDFVDGFASV